MRLADAAGFACLAGLVLLTPPAGGNPPDSSPDCAALLAGRPAARETALCYFGRAEAEGGAGPATETLEQLAYQRPELPWLAHYLGHLWWLRPEAEDLFRQAIGEFRRQADTEGEVLARLNLFLLLTRSGRMEEAGEEVSRLLEITEASQDAELRVWGALAEARHLFNTGNDLGRAYDLLRGLEVPASMAEDKSVITQRTSLLANVCIAIGRFQEAQAAYRSLLHMASAQGNAYVEATARYNLALIAYEKLRVAPTEPERKKAIRLAREARVVASEVGHRWVEIMASSILGSMIPGDEGKAILEQCFEAAETPDLKSLCLNPLAARMAGSNPEEARRMIRTSAGLAEKSGDDWARVRVWQEALRVEWATRPAEQALGASATALDAIETLRDRQPRGSSVQAGVFSLWSDDYAWLAGRLLEAAGQELGIERASAEAFQVTERMRARGLADWLDRTEASASTVAVAAKFRGLDQVQSALSSDEALLSFQVAPWEDVSGDFAGGSWLLAVTRDAVTVHRLPGRVELRRSVDLFEGLIERRDGAEGRVAARLYEKLLAPALAELPPKVSRLILVPDDALHRLPFSALRASVDAEPLGSRYELVRVPSATLWLGWREARTSAPARPLLVLADPDSPLAGDSAGSAEVAVAQRLDGPPARVRDAAQGLGRLPHARREGRAAVRALGEGLLLVGAEASEARLGALPLGEFGLLHFAAHAVTDEDRPERSAVLLTPGGGHDGLLRSAEIAGLDLSGRTVVLASCRSASGTVLRGEGVMSLGRAFFQAGAHGVVASLWPLRDDESEALFGRVYRHLGRGASVGEALHRARREAIEAGEPAAAWAGLVMLGDGATVPLPGGGAPSPRLRGGWLALWVLLALALVAGAIAAWRLRSRAD